MTDGTLAVVGFVPEERLGVVVLTNMRRNLFYASLFRYALSLFLGLPPEDPVDGPGQTVRVRAEQLGEVVFPGACWAIVSRHACLGDGDAAGRRRIGISQKLHRAGAEPGLGDRRNRRPPHHHWRSGPYRRLRPGDHGLTTRGPPIRSRAGA